MADNQENGNKSADTKTDETVKQKATADKKDDEKDDKEVKPAEKTEEAKSEEAKSEEKTDDKKTETKDILDEIDGGDGDLILENQRESILLTPKNARFYRSKGNLISLELTAEGKETEVFERVIMLRSFPVTNPDEFLSVREPDTKKNGRGKEIGMIRRMSDFDEATSMLFLEELDRRYFSPQLLRIISCKEKFGYTYWDAETTAGHVTFILNNPFYNIRVLEDGRIFINDIDGNSFEIPDPKQLDPASFRKIEIYL